LLVSTNTHEGNLFIPTATLVQNNFTFREYVTQLFPRLNQHQIDQIVDIYLKINLTAVPDLAAAVMGDCKAYHLSIRSLDWNWLYLAIFICPAYYSVSAFGRQGRKVCEYAAFVSPVSDISGQAKFAVPPAFHAEDLSYEFDTWAFCFIALDVNM
jgi:hypothetical protein